MQEKSFLVAIFLCLKLALKNDFFIEVIDFSLSVMFKPGMSGHEWAQTEYSKDATRESLLSQIKDLYEWAQTE